MNKLYLHKHYIFSGLLILFLLQSCGIFVSYIKTSDTRNNINQSEETIKKNMAIIKTENKVNSSLFTQFKDRNIDLTVKPYPELLKLHNSMLNDELIYTRQNLKLKKMADEFKIVIHGESEIDEKSPYWKQVTDFYDKYEDASDERSKNNDKFYSKLKQFRTIADDHKILLAKVTDIKKRMNVYNTNLASRLSKIQNLMTEINNGVELKHSKKLSSEQLKKVKDMKIQINDFSLYFNYVQKHINNLFLDISNDMKGFEYVWTIPESDIRKNFELVEQDTEVLNLKILELKKTWKSI